MYKCPDCGNDLVYVDISKRWFCGKCNKYPASVFWNTGRQTPSSKKSIINYVIFTAAVISIVIIISLTCGMLITHDELTELYENEENEDHYDEHLDNYYHSNYGHYGHDADDDDEHEDDDPALDLFRGLYLTIFSMILLGSIIGLFSITVRNRKWWLRQRLLSGSDRKWHLDALEMKYTYKAMYFGITLLIFIVGMIFMIIGLVYLFSFYDHLMIVSTADTFIGLGIIILSYMFYSSELEHLSLEITPVLTHQTKPKEEKKPERTLKKK